MRNGCAAHKLYSAADYLIFAYSYQLTAYWASSGKLELSIVPYP